MSFSKESKLSATQCSVEELEKMFAGADIGSNNMPILSAAGVGSPLLLGRFEVETLNQDDFTTTKEVYLIIRWVPHVMVNDKSIDVQWVDQHTLELIIRWPRFFSKITRHIGFQSANTEAKFQFEANSPVFKSMFNLLACRAERSDPKNIFFFDKWQIDFENPMDKTFIRSEMLNVELTNDDIDYARGETMPAGNAIPVHQIILKEKPRDDEKKKHFTTTSRNAKSGTFIFFLLINHILTSLISVSVVIPFIYTFRYVY